MNKYRHHMTRFLLCFISLLVLGRSAVATADINTAMASMENSSNPLMLMRTSRGDIYIELFPQSAPRNVANFIALASAQVPLFDTATATTITPHFYDGLTFHRILRNYLVQSGTPPQQDAPTPEYLLDDEINARQFGLQDIPVLDELGKPHPWLNLGSRKDFDQAILVPLYRRLGIDSPAAVYSREFEIHAALQSMNLRQAYEGLGYRYNERLVSREALRGSVAMASSGPNSNSSEFFISLIDAPWLNGRVTVIGTVVEGMEIVDRIDQAAILSGEATTPTPISATLIFDIRQVNASPLE
jgi:cyclophilin family peptidyl-prolyl cis-trans isomerase